MVNRKSTKSSKLDAQMTKREVYLRASMTDRKKENTIAGRMSPSFCSGKFDKDSQFSLVASPRLQFPGRLVVRKTSREIKGIRMQSEPSFALDPVHLNRTFGFRILLVGVNESPGILFSIRHSEDVIRSLDDIQKAAYSFFYVGSRVV